MLRGNYLFSKINIIVLTVLFLGSCTTVEMIGEKINILKPKETPEVAGKLVCAAAGIESDDCIEAVNKDDKPQISEDSYPEIKPKNTELNDQSNELEPLLK